MATATDGARSRPIAAIVSASLRNRLLIVAAGLLMMAFGYYVYVNLPVEAFPDVSPVLVQVYTVTEGLAPEEVEQYVTYPIEVTMNGLPRVAQTRSISNFGLSLVNIYFEDGMDIYFARQLVNERLQEAREQIPEGFGEPQMGPISTSMGMVLNYYLEDSTGTHSLEELRTIQDWIIKFHLQTVPGVTEVLGIGGYEKQYQVIIDPESLLRYDLALPEVIGTIEKNNLNVGGQFIVRNAEEFIVRSQGLATSLEDLRGIMLKSVDGIPVLLGHVAEVTYGPAIRRGLQTLDGEREVVGGIVLKLVGTNSSQVIERVEAKVEEVNKALPEGVEILPYYEQKTLVQSSVATVSHALMEGIALVVIVLAIFLGAFRPSLVVSLAIPFSLLFAILGMGLFGITVNLMSLGGLAIAIGMLVDGAIIIVENIHRRFTESDPGEPKEMLVAEGSAEVVRPIVFAISIIIVVFLPLFTLHGIEGKTFKPLAFTLTLALLGSLVFALILAPALSSLLMRSPRERRSDDDKPRGIVTRALRWAYKPVVTLFVEHKWLMLIVAAFFLVAGLWVLPQLGSEFVPVLQEGTTVCRMTMAPSISLEESARMTLIVERRLLAIPEVIRVVTRVGRGEVGAHTHPPNIVESFLCLKPKQEWRGNWSQDRLEEIIRHELGEVRGVKVNITQPIEMTVDHLLEGIKTDLAIKIYGDDLDFLKEKADEIVAVVREVPGAADIQAQQVVGAPQLRISIDRKAIARFGIDVSDVQAVISAAVGGAVAGEIFEGVRRFDILVRYPEADRSDRASIGNILVRAPGGERVPLRQLAAIEELVGPREITRQDSQRFIAVECNVEGRDIGTFVADATRAIDAEVELPTGYLMTWGGQYKLQQEANARLAVVIPVALLLIFLLLYLCFGSVRNSLLILLNIPLALVGGIAALWISGQYLSIPASVGFIALFGIALEDGMVMVTVINQLLRGGRDINAACIEGACIRIRPVLMTTATTALALIPLLFATGTGSEVQRPLAAVVVGGLLTSTVMTLLVLPALFKWFVSERSLRKL